jgi:cupin 2 domain-containing protein
MEDEWVCLVSGQARLKLREPDESLDLRPGDCLFIPAHRQHRVEWTSHSTATVWLAVFIQKE